MKNQLSLHAQSTKWYIITFSNIENFAILYMCGYYHQGWWKEFDPCSWWWLIPGWLTTGISKLLPSVSGVATSLTSDILASVAWISLHSLSPTGWMLFTWSVAMWTTFSAGIGFALETLRHALSTFSSVGSTCFVSEHDSVFSTTWVASMCCLLTIKKINYAMSNLFFWYSTFHSWHTNSTKTNS